MRFVPIFLFALLATAAAEIQVLQTELSHLRFGDKPEWSEFPQQADSERIQLAFQSKVNNAEQTLLVRQQDVKQQWVITINGKPVGKLRIDENEMIETFAIPPGTLVDGENRLVIEQPRLRARKTDDIRVGWIRIDSRPMSESLSDTQLTIKVIDADSGQQLPSRITVLNADGAMQKVGAESNDHLAVRPGIVYTSTGEATFGLPAGDFEIIAGRGFEYSIDRHEIKLEPGDKKEATLEIRRVVNTTGYVACDPHTHTLTHSGHGDATVQERMITLAAEGIELPIATDHNVHVDQDSFARELGVRKFFTPVIGNEVTTKVGHFNIWPVESADVPPPDWKSMDWAEIFDGIYATPGVKAVMLNHGRDLHGGTTPLGPLHHNALVGQNLDGWVLRANAMETINSGATQTDVLQLFHDWMGLLNRGFKITPAGTSDSHDVGRHFVGQGRTYIRVDDSDPGAIDVSAAADAFVAGRVTMSYGLFAEIEINGKKSGEIVSLEPGQPFEAFVRVAGPEWVENVDAILIFRNGELVWESAPDSYGKFQFDLVAGEHDEFITAIALGPGIDSLHWKSAKPYKPDSPNWTPRVAACSGAIWIDGDGDGEFTSARGYAEALDKASGGDFADLAKRLTEFDRAVSLQAANLLYRAERWPTVEKFDQTKVDPKVQMVFNEFYEEQKRLEQLREEAKQSPN